MAVAPFPATHRDGRAAGLGLRALVALRRSALDWRLAESPADIGRSAQLLLRAQQLSSPGTRARLADNVERALERTAPRAPVVSTAIARQLAEVDRAHDELARLAAELRSRRTADPVAVAMVSRLLTDGCGPLYAPHPPGTLAATARSIRAIM